METSVLTSKWQIIIPKKIRKELGFRPNTRMTFLVKNGDLVIRPLDKSYFQKFVGILSGKGDVLKGLLTEKKKERAL